MEKIKNINVIFGGSFNPPTVAHYEISKQIIEYFNVLDFVFMPTGNNYSKPELIKASHRYNMLELVCKKLKNARVSDFEMTQEKYKGTYYMLEHFKGYYFVLGADNVKDIVNWINFPKVVSDNKFIVLNRNNIDLSKILNQEKLINYKDNFIIFNDFTVSDVSSSKYRMSLDPKYVLEEVHEYCVVNKLY